MKKFIIIALAIMLLPSIAFAVTPDTTSSAQGIFSIFKFGTVSDGDTFTGPTAPKAYWIQPISSTTACYGHVTYSAGTYTFELNGSSVSGLFLFVVR
jgi:hypothetical protein